jgi:hypothetical protein
MVKERFSQLELRPPFGLKGIMKEMRMRIPSWAER